MHRSIPLILLLAMVSAMTATAQGITGTATFRERIAVPPEAVFEASLLDVSRADAPARTITRLSMHDPGNPPFRFVLPYRAEAIEANHSYAVRATLKAGGQLLFTSDTHTPVLTRGAGTEVEIMMVRATGPAPGHAMGADGITGVHWDLVELGGKAVPKAAEGKQGPHLMLEAGADRYHGSGGCNRMNGSYELSGSALRLGPAASTRMMCPGPAMELETHFFQTMGAVTAATREGDMLRLTDATGVVIARFRAGGHGGGVHQGGHQDDDGCL